MNNQINLFRSLIDHGRLVLRLMMERRVPLYLKLLPLAAVAYLIWPLDFLPDLMPFLGQLDDLAALLVGLEAFVALCPQHVVAQIRAELRGEEPFTKDKDETIDGQWKE
jgi:uncharacterized membrane protein YkvA (DUF1232 family)